MIFCSNSVVTEDYEFPTPDEIIFASGTTSDGDTVCVSVPINDDDAYEEDEDFSASISSASPTSATMVTAGSVTKTIQDNAGW